MMKSVGFARSVCKNKCSKSFVTATKFFSLLQVRRSVTSSTSQIEVWRLTPEEITSNSQVFLKNQEEACFQVPFAKKVVQKSHN